MHACAPTVRHRPLPDRTDQPGLELPGLTRRRRTTVSISNSYHGAIPRRHKTEWMTCRVGEDPCAVWPRLIVELRPTQGEHGSLGRVEVVDTKMEVKLHGGRWIRPSRRPMARRSLERQVEACLLALAHRVPVVVGVDHGPPRKPAIELRERGGIAAFQGDSAQPANTAHVLQPTRRPATALPDADLVCAGLVCPLDTRQRSTHKELWLPIETIWRSEHGSGRGSNERLSNRQET
jgi:hypothetical protein